MNRQGGSPAIGHAIKSWLVIGLLLATTAYVVAEEITLTTYYPSPRGIYQELRSTSNTLLATQGGSVGIGTDTIPATNPKLYVNGHAEVNGDIASKKLSASQDVVVAGNSVVAAVNCVGGLTCAKNGNTLEIDGSGLGAGVGFDPGEWGICCGQIIPQIRMIYCDPACGVIAQ